MVVNIDTALKLTSFQEKIDSFETKMAAIETNILNPMGYVPVVSSFSAAARATMAWIQGLSFATLAAFYAVEGMQAKGDEKKVLHEKTWRCLNEAAHAVLNHGRAQVEAVPILGNLAVIVYDFVLKERFKYPNEPANPLKEILKENYDMYAPVVQQLAEPYYNRAKETVDAYLKENKDA